jgi:phage shock protein A
MVQKELMWEDDMESPEYPMDTIRNEVRKRLEALGHCKYYDESLKYLVAGEAIAKTNSEKRLILDIQYLQTKVKILEDMVLELMVEKENAEANKRLVQMDIFGEKVNI